MKSIPIYFEKEDNAEENSLFLPVKIYLLHAGINLKNSVFDKEVVEQSLYTLKNIPILGYIRINEDEEKDFSGHEHILEIKEDGYRLIYAGFAYGVIPEKCNPRWEFRDDKEFLVCNGLLWKKFQDTIDIFERDNIKKQSMELSPDSIEGYIDDDGLFHFKKFAFEGACILGDHKQEGMEGSTIEKINFSFENFKGHFEQMFQDLKICNYISEEEVGSEDSIEINNSKESANTSGSWGDVDKSNLDDELMKASNYEALVNEAYLIVEEGYETAPSQHLKYPHHVVQDGKLVVHQDGCESALAYLKSNDPENDEALDHLERHYTELDLNVEDNFEKEGNKVDEILKLFTKLTDEDVKDIKENIDNYSTEQLVEELRNKEYEKMHEENKNKIVYELSYEDIRDQIMDKLNPMDEEGGMRVYNYWVMEVYDEYCYVEDEENLGTYYKVPYTVENEEVSLGEMEQVYLMFLNEEEKQEVDDMRNNFESIKKERDELLQEKRTGQEQEIFDRYSKVLDEETIKEYKGKASQFTVEGLEAELKLCWADKNLKFETKNKDDLSFNFESPENRTGKPYEHLIPKKEEK